MVALGLEKPALSPCRLGLGVDEPPLPEEDDSTANIVLS